MSLRKDIAEDCIKYIEANLYEGTLLLQGSVHGLAQALNLSATY
jgi:hypothetical protein